MLDRRPLNAADISSNPDAWEDTERKCSALEAELRARDLWEDTELFVNDENETGGPQVAPKKGWGESIAGALFGGASALAAKLTGRSNSEEVLPTARGQYDGTYPPSPSVETPPAATTPEGEKKPQHFKALAEHSWAQATIAARGIGEAAAAVGGAVGQTAKNAFDGIKDGVSERDEIPESAAPAVPAKDTKAALNTDKPVPPAPKDAAGAKDEVDALDEPVLSGAIKKVKLNEVVPVTPDERDTKVVDIKPEAVAAALQPEPETAAKTEETEEKSVEKPKEEEVKINEVVPITPDEPDTQVEDIKPDAVADDVKKLKIDDDAGEQEFIKEEAAAIVAASDAELKGEAEDKAAEEETAKEEDKAETEKTESSAEGAKDSAGEKKPAAGGKKKNKKNKKKN